MYVSIKSILEAAKPPGGEKASKVSSSVSHCVLAVMAKGHDAKSAWNICRAAQTKYGYLKGPYKEKGKASDVKMTMRGTRLAMKHSMEREAPSKFKAFSKAFLSIEPGV